MAFTIHVCPATMSLGFYTGTSAFIRVRPNEMFAFDDADTDQTDELIALGYDPGEFSEDPYTLDYTLGDADAREPFNPYNVSP